MAIITEPEHLRITLDTTHFIVLYLSGYHTFALWPRRTIIERLQNNRQVPLSVVWILFGSHYDGTIRSTHISGRLKTRGKGP